MKDMAKNLFLQGNYEKVLTSTDDLSSSKRWVIGALCFTGRKEEAEALLRGLEVKVDPLTLTACRFYLGVAYCRHGNYRRACGYFAQNLSEHHGAGGELGFFAWQGLAFYRYFCADFGKSEKAALRSLTCATFTSDAYGRALSLDIIGHSLIQQGRVSAGLIRLAEAQKWANRMGNGGLSSSIEISSLVYRAQYGLEPRTIVQEIQRARKKLDPQNSYAHANLLLETANQQLLRGRVGNAVAALNEASTLIYGSQHRRYAHLLALRFAEVSYRRGEFASALHSVQMHRAALDAKHDRANLLMALGLEIKLLRAMKMEEQMAPLLALLTSLTQKTERSISKTILLRQKLSSNATSEEDKIERIFYAERSRVLNSEYLSRAYEVLGLPVGTEWLVVRHDELLVLDKGEVSRFRQRSGRIPGLLVRVLESLSAGPRSKEELVREIWGYRYHPLQHDPLLYQAVGRLRELLRNQSAVIEVTEGGYRLRSGFGFILLTESGDVSQREPRHLQISETSPPPVQAKVLPAGLNERQIRILNWLRQKPFLGVRDCAKRFKVSTMTLKRDFAGLMQGGWVQRVGRARATRYALASLKQNEILGA